MIKGTKERRFSSKAIHTRSQWEEERAMIVLAVRVAEKIVREGKMEFINL